MSSVSNTPKCSIVTVEKGDTLSAIAAKCGEKTEDVLAANHYLEGSFGCKPRTAGGDLIYPGDRVFMPSTMKLLNEMMNQMLDIPNDSIKSM